MGYIHIYPYHGHLGGHWYAVFSLATDLSVSMVCVRHVHSLSHTPGLPGVTRVTRVTRMVGVVTVIAIHT